MIMVRKNELACRDEWAHDLWEDRSSVAGPDSEPIVVPFPTGPVKPATEVEIAALIRADAAATPPPARDVVLSEMGGASDPLRPEDRGPVETPTRPVTEWPRPERRNVPLQGNVQSDASTTGQRPSNKVVPAWDDGKRWSGQTMSHAVTADGSGATNPWLEASGPSPAMPDEFNSTTLNARQVASYDDLAAAGSTEPQNAAADQSDHVETHRVSETTGMEVDGDELEPERSDLEPEWTALALPDVVVSDNTQQPEGRKRQRGFRLADLFSRRGAHEDSTGDGRSSHRGTRETEHRSSTNTGVRTSSMPSRDQLATTPRLEPLLEPRAESRTVSQPASDLTPHLDALEAKPRPESSVDGLATLPMTSADSEWSAETAPIAHHPFVSDHDDQSAVTGSVLRERQDDRWPLADQSRTSLSRPVELTINVGALTQMQTGPRHCRSCRDYRPADGGERGWCANEWAFSHRRMVESSETAPCAAVYGDWWTPNDAAWFESSDVSSHGQATPLLDAFVPDHRPVDPARRRS